MRTYCATRVAPEDGDGEVSRTRSQWGRCGSRIVLRFNADDDHTLTAAGSALIAVGVPTLDFLQIFNAGFWSRPRLKLPRAAASGPRVPLTGVKSGLSVTRKCRHLPHKALPRTRNFRVAGHSSMTDSGLFIQCGIRGAERTGDFGASDLLALDQFEFE